jgi:hypothetical protein
VDLLSYKALLSKKDIEEAPDERKYAPMLVSTNAERLNVSRIKARTWAKEHKAYVFLNGQVVHRGLSISPALKECLN